MENPFGANGEIKKETDDESTIEPTGVQSLNEEVVKEDIKVVEEEKKVKSSSVKVQLNKSRKQKILDQYGGLESNVPINSAYWKMKG